MKKLVIAGLLAIAPVLAAAQQGVSDKPEIRVILQPARSLPADHPLAPDALAGAVGQILGDAGYRWERIGPDEISVGDTAIRILYVVSEQGEGGDKAVVAASAATALLQRANIGSSTLTLSLYNGIQQSIGQEPATAAARAEVYQSFVSQLRQRINEALRHLERQ